MTRIFAAVLACLGTAACGPVQSTAFLLDADVQLEAARTAGAEERAPYHWTAANLYLHKAREEVGYAEYEVALAYAQKAERFALEARERATVAPPPDVASPPPPPVIQRIEPPGQGSGGEK